MTARESALERRAGELARRKGCLFIKVGLQGWPDRVVIGPDGRHVWVEFKSKTGRPTGLQVYRLETLTRQGCRATLVRDFETFERIVNEITAA